MVIAKSKSKIKTHLPRLCVQNFWPLLKNGPTIIPSRTLRIMLLASASVSNLLFTFKTYRYQSIQEVKIFFFLGSHPGHSKSLSLILVIPFSLRALPWEVSFFDFPNGLGHHTLVLLLFPRILSTRLIYSTPLWIPQGIILSCNLCFRIFVITHLITRVASLYCVL